jgi:POT family proton-dependent oligopeptide transporter
MLGFTWKNKQGKFNWDVAKPSNVPVERRPAWMTYDDAWVDEVKRGLRACKVFLFLPLVFVSGSLETLIYRNYTDSCYSWLTIR